MKDLFPFYRIGHFINQPENKTEFEVFRFDEIEEPDVEALHKHTFYEIIWIEKGQSRQVIDYTEYEINPGTLFFISPGQLHAFEEWKPVSGGCIMFTEDFFLVNQQDKERLFELSFLDNFYSTPVFRPEKKALNEILTTVKMLHEENQRQDFSVVITQGLLQVLLQQIQRSLAAQSKNTVDRKYLILFKKFKQLIDQHFIDKWTVSDYASALSVTQHHLNFISKQVTGRTATEVIRARAVLEAKRLLSFSGKTVSEIANSLGFFDSSYFAKVFKAETGTTPQMFQASISESYRRK